MISSLTEKGRGENIKMDDKRMAAADSQRNAPVAKATKINSLGCTEGETSDERGGRGGMTKQDEAPKPNLNPDFFVKRCRVCVPGGAERRERERERERERKGTIKRFRLLQFRVRIVRWKLSSSPATVATLCIVQRGFTKEIPCLLNLKELSSLPETD